MSAVEQLKAAGHRPADKIELGHTRRVCSKCAVDWPCPDVAQAAERDATQEVSR